MTEEPGVQTRIARYMREIEEGEIYLDAMLANTPVDLLRRLARNPQIEEMRRTLSRPEVVRLLNDRIAALLQEDNAPDGYASPHDLPLATYLFLLERMPLSAILAQWQVVADSERDDLRSARFVASEMLRRRAEDQAVREAFLPERKLIPTVRP